MRIAAFKLGRLFEHGIRSPDAASGVFNADTFKAWSWYQKGADAGDPNALARFAERDVKHALAQTGPLNANSTMLEAFTFYAAAAELSREEEWPDEAWKSWRFRRATLARLLANGGMMHEVADAYSAMLAKRAPRPSMWWERAEARVHW
jgi:TPR repeat protein